MGNKVKLDAIPKSRMFQHPFQVGESLSLRGVKEFVRGSMLSIEEIVKEVTANRRLLYESSGRFTPS